MKKLLILITCLCLMTGCSNKQKNDENHLNVAMFWISTSLDPSHDYDGWVLSRIGVGETLFKLNEQYEVEPLLASSYENIDDYTWKITLKEDVKFSNGKVLEANDIKKCLERAFAQNPRAKDYFDLKEVTYENNEVYIHLNRPSGAIINNLCEPLFTIYDLDSGNVETSPICTGPYVITNFKSENIIDVVSNENYHDGSASLDSIHFVEIADSDSRVMALQNGDVDLVTTIDYSNLDLFKDESKYHISEVLGPRTNVIYMNNTNEFLSQLPIRKALSMACNRDEIVSLIGGTNAKGLYPTALPYGYFEDLYAYSIEKANQVLDEANMIDTNQDGIREYNGKNIILHYYGSADHGSADSSIISQHLQGEVKKIGIQMELHQVENLNEIKNTGAFDLCFANDSTAPTGDPEVFLQLRYLTGGSSNTARYSNEKVDQLINELYSIYDLDKRHDKASEITQVILEDAASIYVSYIPLNMIVSSDVKNAKMHPVDYYLIDKDISISHE